MRREYLISAIIVIMIMGLLIVCAKKEPVVASVNGREITLTEFKSYFQKANRKRDPATASIEELKAGLDELMKHYLKIQYAYELKLDQDSLVVLNVKDVQVNHLLQRLYKMEVLEKVITEKDIRDFYAKKAHEVVFRSIFINCPQSAEPEELSAAEAKAAEVMKRLNKGEDFADLAKIYSDDEDTKSGGGFVGSLTYQRSDDAVHNLIFATPPGRIAGPVRNRLGFNIIKVEELKPRERLPYEKARPQIQQQLGMERRQKINETGQKYQDDLMQSKKVTYEDTVMVLLSDTIDAMITGGEADVLGTLAKADESLLSRVVAKYKGGQVDVADFIYRLQNDPGRGRIHVKTKNDVSNLLNNWLLVDFLLERARSKGLLKDKPASRPYYDALEKEMVRRLNQMKFRYTKDIPEEKLREYYEKIKYTKFFTPEKRQVQEIMSKSMARVKSLLNRIRNGEDFTELAKSYTERSGFQKKEGILGYMTEDQWGGIGRVAFSIKQGEVSEPFRLENEPGYSIIRILDIRPERVRSFEQSRNLVENEFRQIMVRAEEAKWLEEQKKVKRVIIEENILANAFSEQEK